MGILTVAAPKGAACGLYSRVPGSLNYSLAIDLRKAIPTTRITEADGVTSYHHEDLPPPFYKQN